ncbi:oligosaccharide flippase family protein [Hahella ganghwensis]|uniref:oligosaccharide flippase family protein n=1 Tax=Hahella ganghwensis TaxID=286420 RepID=UPI00037824BA|nr:oligosaccharide flippase family protein [Hahella ganghwensis]
MNISTQRILKNAAYLLSANTIATAIGFLTLILTARYLGPDDFGFLVLIQAYVTLYVTVLNFQTAPPAIKYGTEYVHSHDLSGLNQLLTLFISIDLLISILGGILAYAVYFILLDTSLSDIKSQVVCVYLATIFFNISGSFNGLLRIANRFLDIGRAQVALFSMRFLMVCLVMWFDGSLLHMAIAWAIPEILTHILVVFWGLRAYRSQFGEMFRLAAFRIKHFRSELGFMVANNFDVSIRALSKQLDVILLGLFAGKEVVGLYKIAVQLCSLPLRFTDPIYQSLLPELSSMHSKGQYAQSKSIVTKFALYGLLVFLGVYLVFLLIGEPVIGLIFGEEYLGVFPIMSWYLVAVSGGFIGLPFVPYFHSLGLARSCLNIQIVATSIYLVFLYFLTRDYHAIGAAAAYIVYFFVWLVLAIGYFRRCKY